MKRRKSRFSRSAQGQEVSLAEDDVASSIGFGSVTKFEVTGSEASPQVAPPASIEESQGFNLVSHRPRRSASQRKRRTLMVGSNEDESSDLGSDDDQLTRADPHLQKRSSISVLRSQSDDISAAHEVNTISSKENISAPISSYELDVNEIDPLDMYMQHIHEAEGSSTAVGPKDAHVFSGDELMSELDEEEALGIADSSAFLERKKRRRLVYEPVNHSIIDYPPFEKNIYHEAPEITRMSAEDVERQRRALGNIRVRGKRCPRPICSFGQCGLSSSIMDVMARAGFRTPTPIQAQAIPCIMSGRDIIGVAKTGSGKTLAFLLPVLRHILLQAASGAGEGPIALLVAPTRELATQIYGEGNRFARAIGRRCACAYGGSGLKDQIADLKRGADIVVCTPGRMIDLLALNNGRITNLRRVTMVVLDEADRMFDLGFEPQLTRVIENVRPDRQTVLFSATFPPQVEKLARKILKQPIEIIVGGNSIAATSIDQHVEVRTEDSKFRRLLQLLGEWYERGSTLIFVDRQDHADRMYRELSQAGYLCLPLHGGMDQADRESALVDFKNGDVKVLVATSIAARGLDVKQLNLVVNYDVPNHYEDYVHRVGRTGRAGRWGTSYTFITPEQDMHAADLVKALELSARAAVPNNDLSSDELKDLSDKAAQSAVPNELRALAKSFEVKKDARRKAGEIVRTHTSGYGGRGFTFHEDEESTRAALQKSQAQRFKTDTEGEELDDFQISNDKPETDNDVEIKVVDRQKLSRGANGRHANAETVAVAKIGPGDESRPGMEHGIIDSDIKTMIALAEEKVRAEAARENLSPGQMMLRVTQAKAQVLAMIAERKPGGTLVTDVGPVHERLSSNGVAAAHGDSALSAAAAAAAALSARLGKVAQSMSGVNQVRQEVGTDGNAVGGLSKENEARFEAELEINDYPQHARWRVTHANALVDVTENTGCVVTARGNYYPPGRNPPAGERKLHLLIEGEDERSIRAAWKEIKLKLEEAAAARPDDKGSSYAKYSVL